MSYNILDTEIIRTMFLAGAKNLEKDKEWINDLNVFPVPDGDTGTNMTLTILSAVKEVQNVSELDMPVLAKAISSGSLRGARGNSGVILSQLFRGFTKEMAEKTELDKFDIASACRRATETAYKAVMKPKEGTILTVARSISDKATELAESDMTIDDYLDALIKAGDESLANTPNLLPVLKEAGVVDSGGQGLMQFLKGAYMGLTGSFDDSAFSEYKSSGIRPVMADSGELGDITFGYCTEFLVMTEKTFTAKDESDFKAYLNSIGDCVVVVADDDVVKVHVHTNEPGNAIQKGLSYGELSRMKIDNMREEHEEKLIKEASKQASAGSSAPERHSAPAKTYGFIAVSSGDGLTEVFKSLGADEIISGGQTMNPCTEDFLEAIEKINADNIFILPNNKNIILAAEQAGKITEDKRVYVLHAKTIPQGVTAMISFDEEIGPEENFLAMKQALTTVKTGQVTYAVRDTVIDGTNIHENDLMGIGDSSALLSIGNDLSVVARDMASAMIDEDSSIITIYYGEGVSEEEASELADTVEKANPDCDVEVCRGGQPIYYYIISVE